MSRPQEASCVCLGCRTVTINTGPGTRGLGTQGLEDREPGDQGPNNIALLHLAFMTEMQLVSMF